MIENKFQSACGLGHSSTNSSDWIILDVNKLTKKTTYSIHKHECQGNVDKLLKVTLGLEKNYVIIVDQCMPEIVLARQNACDFI